MKRKVSMKDIAQKLGVSTALVSYVLNNQLTDRINKDTAEKIRLLAEELNYRPNHIAKSLKSNKTNTIGLIVADISNPFSANLARIIEDEAKKSKYTVIFGSADESSKKSQDLINVLLSRQVDGFIIAPAVASEKQLLSLQKQGIPFVLIDRYFPQLNFNAIVLNNFNASYQAVSHLIANGYKRIGMINFKSELFHLLERERGYHQALVDHDRVPAISNLKTVTERNITEEIKLSIDQLLKEGDGIDALFFGSNNLSIEGLAYLKNLGLNVPQDLAIVCFDEDKAYNLFKCPITYIRQPLLEIGNRSVKTLLNAINVETAPQTVVLEGELICHESSQQKI